MELKSVGNFVAKTVFIESANQFSLEDLCRTQYVQHDIFFDAILSIRLSGKSLRGSFIGVFIACRLS